MHVPAATYRIQFSPSFTFGDARRVVPCLASLGIYHLYASPIFRAGQESTHGYDVVDQNRVNPELGDPGDFAGLVGEVMSNGLSWLQDCIPNHKRHMAGDVDNLAHLLKSVSGRYRYGSDITLYGLKRAILEVMAFFPVCRTYLNSGTLSGEDRKWGQLAVKNAIARNSAYLNELKLIERFFLPEGIDHLQAEEREERIYFIIRFQQFTGPLMAKGFEDTLLYVYNRLLSLNEVGGAPDVFGTRRDDFHLFIEKRMAFWPHSMNATSTHNTKGGEDVRSRINVLSHFPAALLISRGGHA